MTAKIAPMIGAFATGAAAAYLLDPDRGRRRRSLLRDRASHLRHSFENSVPTATRDLGNRTYGVFGEARYRIFGGNADDPVLEGRVRSKIGRAVAHPHSVHVDVQDGTVTLTGSILEREKAPLMSAVYSVPGVREIRDNTRAYANGSDIPGRQGRANPGRLEQRPDFLQESWSPATRAVVGVGGATMTYWGLRRGGILGIPAIAGGTGLILRAATNMPFKRIFGIGAGRRAIDVRKTVNINAPLQTVFDTWSNPANFPRFMSHVKEVNEGSDGRSHWTVTGPLNLPMQWDAEITRYEPERVLAWRTLPGASVEHAGIIHFDENPDGTTRAHVQMSYNPPAGAAGHVVAQLFRSDPKQQMDEDLMRMKTFIETGKVPGDAQRTPVGASAS